MLAGTVIVFAQSVEDCRAPGVEEAIVGPRERAGTGVGILTMPELRFQTSFVQEIEGSARLGLSRTAPLVI